MQKFDIAIIGGGILGTSISYWLSALYDLRICVIEKETSVAQHTSKRNTGVVHSPFYLDPKNKKNLGNHLPCFARFMGDSREKKKSSMV